MSSILPIVGREVAAPALRIGDLARQAGKSTRAVRLYEDLGLLGPAHRTEGGHRVYGDDARVRLGWIDKLQVLGMSLPDIKSFLDELEDAATGPAAMERVRGMFRTKLAEVRAQVDALEALSAELTDGLSYLETCHDCSTNTDLGGCRACDHDHAIEAPLLITGIHRGAKGSE